MLAANIMRGSIPPIVQPQDKSSHLWRPLQGMGATQIKIALCTRLIKHNGGPLLARCKVIGQYGKVSV